METKRKVLWGFIFLFLVAETLCAQNNLFFSVLGSDIGDEEMESIIHTSDNGLLIAGTSDSFSNNEDGDLLLLKTDINGNIQWAKTFGGAADDMATDVKETTDGGYIVAGWTQSFGAEGYDYWMLKVDLSGDIQWQNRYGGSGNEQAWSVSVENNGYFVVGGTDSFGAGLTDLWALKLDLDSNIIWQKTYGSSGDDAPPGPYEEYVAKGLTAQNGDYLIAGESDGVGHGGTDIYLVRINNATGNIIWQYAYGNEEDESIWSFCGSPTGGFYLPGSTTDPNAFDGDLWVVYVDESGTIQWQKSFGISNLWDEALNASSLADGSIVMASYFEQDDSSWTASALKADVNGNLVWANNYNTGDLDWINAVFPLDDNSLSLVGVTTSTTTWDEDITLLRTDNSGMVSNCNMITPFSPTIISTTTTKQSINFSISNTSVSPVNTTAFGSTVSLSENTLCSEPLSNVPAEIGRNDITVYPNPTPGDITIDVGSARPKIISVLRNNIGREFARKTSLNSSLINWSVSGTPGIYFIEIYDDNGKITVFKISKY